MTASPPEPSELTVEDLLQRLDEAQTHLANLSREVEHLQRLATVGTLAAGIVHEVNNQLTPALAQAQVARLKEDDPSRLAGALDQCIQCITRAGRIAETMIGFASPTEGGPGAARKSALPDRQPAAANVAQAIKTALICTSIFRDRAAVRIETEVPPAAWVAIEPIALQQVIINLLLNAIKAASDTEAPMVRFSAKHIDGRETEICVEDNGPGIPPALRDKMFAPFASMPTSTRSSKGSGLGLAVSRRLIEAAGGSITAGKSTLGGAGFTVRLRSITASSRANAA